MELQIVLDILWGLALTFYYGFVNLAKGFFPDFFKKSVKGGGTNFKATNIVIVKIRKRSEVCEWFRSRFPVHSQCAIDNCKMKASIYYE